VTSFENVTKRWVPEFRSAWPGRPFLLVGTKTDLRGKDPANQQNKSHEPPIPVHITAEQGQTLAANVNAAGCVECSGTSGEGVDDVFKKVFPRFYYPRLRL
jgi:GTPase SAR1 family protein